MAYNIVWEFQVPRERVADFEANTTLWVRGPAYSSERTAFWRSNCFIRQSRSGGSDR